MTTLRRRQLIQQAQITDSDSWTIPDRRFAVNITPIERLGRIVQASQPSPPPWCS
jgi:hypothetical protein